MRTFSAELPTENDDLRMRTRILKLRWMGLEREAEDLAKVLRRRMAEVGHDAQPLPRDWPATD